MVDGFAEDAGAKGPEMFGAQSLEFVVAELGMVGPRKACSDHSPVRVAAVPEQLVLMILKLATGAIAVGDTL